MIKRVAVSIVITLALLSFARMASHRDPLAVTSQENGMRMSHEAVTRWAAGEAPVISAVVDGADEVHLFYKYDGDPEYGSVRMDRAEGGGNAYTAMLQARPKGDAVLYYIEALRDGGAGAAPSRVDLSDAGRPFVLEFRGHVPSWVLTVHIVTTFAAIFFAAMTLMSAIALRRGDASMRTTIVNHVLALVAMFVGYFPSGFAMAWYYFGGWWSGIPFGWNITDNKSLLIFVMWLVALVLVKGSLLGRGEEKNFVSQRTYSTMVIVSFAVMVALYMVPHGVSFGDSVEMIPKPS